MIDESELREASPSMANHEFAHRPRTVAAPASRNVGPGGSAGRRGFVVLLASGLAINAWALFPSGVQSGVYIPLPQAAPPAAADAVPAGGAGNPLDLSRGMTFSLMEISVVHSHSMTDQSVSGPYLGPADAATMAPLRSKLQALLMLLYLQDGDMAAALELKLQSLLRLPDTVLARLVEHPDLVDLVTRLDAVFRENSDLTGLKTELDKIDVSSMSWSTEQIDVVTVNGKPAYLVRSTAVPASVENIAVSPRFAMPQPPVEFVVVSQVEAPTEVGALMMAAGVESFAAAAPAAESAGPMAAELTVAASIEPPPPDPEPMAPIVTEVTAAQSATTEPTATAAPTSTYTPAAEPTGTPTTSAADLMKTGNKFEPGDTVTGTEVDNTSASQSTPTSEVATTVAPAEEAIHTPTADEGTSAPAADGATGSSGEVSP